ncbi:MAG: hypothetical protein AAF587_44885 [Bacteroidota bacterium]
MLGTALDFEGDGVTGIFVEGGFELGIAVGWYGGNVVVPFDGRSVLPGATGPGVGTGPGAQYLCPVIFS